MTASARDAFSRWWSSRYITPDDSPHRERQRVAYEAGYAAGWKERDAEAQRWRRYLRDDDDDPFGGG